MKSSNRWRIAWLTNAPSADQIDLLAALAARPDVELSVLYCSPHAVKGEIDSGAPLGRGMALTGSTLPGLEGGLFFNPSVIRTLVGSAYDVLIISGYAHLTMQLAMLVRVLQRKPWLLFAERPGLNQASFRRRLLRRIAMYMVPSAAGVIATGRLAREAFASQLDPLKDLFSVPYLINHTDFLCLKRSSRAPEIVSFMACGQLVHRKGFDVLLKAFERAVQVRRDISLTIVGDGPERTALATLITDDCRDRVSLLGPVPFDERVRVFADADVFIHPARHEGWGVVVQEALAAGMPVIATRQTGAAYDLIDPGTNGFLFDAEDEEALVSYINWFADHRAAISEFGRSARAAVAHLTPEWGAAELVRITQSVISRHHPASA